jgi:hypothetical protein
MLSPESSLTVKLTTVLIRRREWHVKLGRWFYLLREIPDESRSGTLRNT